QQLEHGNSVIGREVGTIKIQPQQHRIRGQQFDEPRHQRRLADASDARNNHWPCVQLLVPVVQLSKLFGAASEIRSSDGAQAAPYTSPLQIPIYSRGRRKSGSHVCEPTDSLKPVGQLRLIDLVEFIRGSLQNSVDDALPELFTYVLSTKLSKLLQ